VYIYAQILNLSLMRQLLLIFFTLGVASLLSAQTSYIHCGNLITMEKGEPITLSKKTVVVVANKIDRIEDGFLPATKDITVVDLKNATVLPGLIDCHVHIEWEQSKTTYTEKFTLNLEDIAFRSAIYAKRTLDKGFTTVRDLGGQGVNIALRNAINNGWAVGPRIYTSGRILSITGGHGDGTTGARHDLFDPPPNAEDGIADGPDACRTAVRTQFKRGADCIKVCATGGVISLARDGSLPHYAYDELETIVQTARDLGMPVAAHAHGDEGIRRAILAGVNSIEHGTYMSDSTMDLMISHNTWYVPTLTAAWAVADSARLSKGFFPEVVRLKALEIGPKIEGTLKRAYKKGVPIVFGTDAGVYPHGKNNLEFAYMARAGMSNRDILRSATVNAASLLGWSDKIGTIEKGKFADMIAVENDPMVDMKTMEKVIWVMKDGKVIGIASGHN
jgi:imidazolonepropionase-like amidohydrolase